MSSDKKSSLWNWINNTAVFMAAIATITGFTVMNYDPKTGGWHPFGQSSGQASGSDPSKVQGAIQLREEVKVASPSTSSDLAQNCAALARDAVDDMAQGFVLSAERLQKLRASLHCD